MGHQKAQGFTIIEVILFLAITGVIMSVLLVGVTVGINRERYRDAVSSYQDFLQGQYNQVINVNNSRPSSNPCAGGTIQVGGVADSGPGTSNCTIVGQVIHSSSNGGSVTATKVYATEDAAKLNASQTDAKILQDAKLIADESSTQTYSIDWGTRIVGPKSVGAEPLGFSILIVRMPTSGLVHTFTLKQAGKMPSDIIANSVTAEDFVMCVDTAGLSPGGNVGIVLQADATNSSGVVNAGEAVCA